MATTKVQLPGPDLADLEAKIIDNNGTPVNIIESALPWSVDITLTVTGGGIFDGYAHFDLWVQQIGGTQGGKIGSTFIDFPGNGVYNVNLGVVANHPLLAPADIATGGPLPHPLVNSGVYQLVLVMTHHNAPGGVGMATEATAIIDFGIVRVS
jgi:hypothetical protein